MSVCWKPEWCECPDCGPLEPVVYYCICGVVPDDACPEHGES